jgi:prepilin-type N-terminal cleavage/methylation domain-containing protein
MKRAGFSLAESLVTLFILSIVLGAVGVQMHSYATVMASSDSKQLAITGTQMVLERVRSEALEATSFSFPTPSSGNTTELQFVKLSPTLQSSRLPTTFPASPPASWDPYNPAYQVTVHYYLSGTTLYRDVVGQSSEPVAYGVGGVTFGWLSSTDLEISVSYQERETVQVLVLEVCPFLH